MIMGATPFKGFLLVAEDSNRQVIPGFYSSNHGINNLKCGATHGDNSAKNNVALTFNANQNFAGPVTFR